MKQKRHGQEMAEGRRSPGKDSCVLGWGEEPVFKQPLRVSLPQGSKGGLEKSHSFSKSQSRNGQGISVCQKRMGRTGVSERGRGRNRRLKATGTGVRSARIGE